MEKINRWDHCYGDTELDPDGQYVTYEDHERVVKELEAEVTRLQNNLEACWEEMAGEDA